MWTEVVAMRLKKSVVEYLKKECGYTDDAIKQKEEWLVEKQEYIDRYGMCPVHIQFVEPYDRFVEVFGVPPSIDPNSEPNWKFAILLMMKKEYGTRAGWTIEMAFREFLQNALDGAEEVGYDASSVKVDINGKILTLENPSKKLLIKHLELGGSEKPCWARGKYGEGLNVASSWIVNTGGLVYIRSHDVAYKIVNVEDRLAVLVADIPYIGNKTVVEIYHPDAMRMYKTKDILLPDLSKTIFTAMFETLTCPKKMPNRILERSGDRGLIYQRDILVNDSITAYGKNSIFDYDLWWFGVSRDRSNLASVYEFRSNMLTLYNEIARSLIRKNGSEDFKYLDSRIENTEEYKVLKKIVDECMRPVFTKEGIFFVFEGGYLETEVLENAMYTTTKVFTYVLKNEIAKIIGIDKLDKVGFGVGISMARVRDYLYMGYVPVILNNAQPSMFDLRSIDVMITEKAKEVSKSIKDVSFPASDLKNRLGDIRLKYGASAVYLASSARNFSKTICDALPDAVMGDECLKKYVFFADFNAANVDKDTIGFYDPREDKVYYGIDRITGYAERHDGVMSMFNLAFEEIVHMVTGASDNTAEFEKMLISHARDYATKMSDMLIRAQHTMSQNGLFFDVIYGIKALSELFNEIIIPRQIKEISDKIIGWKVKNNLNRYTFEYIKSNGSFTYFITITDRLPLSHGDIIRELVDNGQVSPIVVMLLTGGSDKELMVLFVVPEDFDDVKLIDAYYGFITTGRSDYRKELFDIVKMNVTKHIEKVEDMYVFVLGLGRWYIMDKSGKQVGEVVTK